MWYTAREKFQNHHIVPISISGPDVSENIATISERKHQELHRILDMNSRLHYNLIRKAREKTNHKMILSPEDMEYRHDAQRLYFERMPRLDWFTRKLHLEKMNQLIWFEADRLLKVWIKQEYKTQTDFESALNMYHEFWTMLSTEIYNIFKRWFLKL